ncbi:MAG: sulfatase [Bacteroidia bacterium]
MKHVSFTLSLFICLLIFNSCKQDSVSTTSSFKTENVIIILIDGPRYSETWGDSTHQYIPGQEAISKEGVVLTDFNNDGTTNTVNGHTAITTGYYENLNNTGMDTPTHPGLFQLFLEHKKSAITDAWIISSKDKLQVLGDCNDSVYKGRYNPQTDCGNNGLFTGYREDSTTFNDAVNILTTFHPHFAFISFKQPDMSGHLNDWNGYLTGLKQSDDYAYLIWQLLQSDPHYKDKTALFITNDHGRHLDSVANGFVSHGDNCSGCRHIMLLAAGPDFKKNATIDKHYGLTDINATISYLFGLKNTGQGVVIEELFK